MWEKSIGKVFRCIFLVCNNCIKPATQWHHWIVGSFFCFAYPGCSLLQLFVLGSSLLSLLFSRLAPLNLSCCYHLKLYHQLTLMSLFLKWPCSPGHHTTSTMLHCYGLDHEQILLCGGCCFFFFTALTMIMSRAVVFILDLPVLCMLLRTPAVCFFFFFFQIFYWLCPMFVQRLFLFYPLFSDPNCLAVLP